MDHNEVVQQKMTEKYLLNELDPKTRDLFEEHYFDCPECAFDVRAGSQFVVDSRVILAEKQEADEVVPARNPISHGWFAWLRPAFAAPALALLLALVGYQNLVTLPQLTRAVRSPQLLPATTVNLLTYGTNGSALVIHSGESFLVNVVIPPGPRYTSYRIELYNPAGNVAESLPIPPSDGETWPIRFPGGKWDDGRYKLTVHGQNPGGQDMEVGSASFELKVQ
jgi:hypothetical protein